jgi:DNA-binding response OmpR family regulator
MKGLIIDDDNLILKSTKILLERKGHEIETRLNPDIAVIGVKRINPDFIIVDGRFENSIATGIDIARFLLKEGYKVGMHSGALEIEKEATEIGIPFLSKGSRAKELVAFPDKIVNQ